MNTVSSMSWCQEQRDDQVHLAFYYLGQEVTDIISTHVSIGKAGKYSVSRLVSFCHTWVYVKEGKPLQLQWLDSFKIEVSTKSWKMGRDNRKKGKNTFWTNIWLLKSKRQIQKRLKIIQQKFCQTGEFLELNYWK